MTHTIVESNFLDKLTELQIEKPETFTFVPENIIDSKTPEDFIFSDSLIDVKKVFKHNNIDISELNNNSAKYRSRKSADFYAPSIFLGLTLLTENPDVISVGLNVLSEYIADFLKGSLGKKEVQLDIYVETKKNKIVKKITYNGNAEGIKALDKIIKKLK